MTVFVKMSNPNVPNSDIQVPEDVVRGHERMGWVVQEDPEPTPEGTPQPEGDEQDPKPASTARRTTPTATPTGEKE
jgi:hypothetical protein